MGETNEEEVMSLFRLIQSKEVTEFAGDCCVNGAFKPGARGIANLTRVLDNEPASVFWP